MGYLGGVEQTSRIGTWDGAEERSVGDAGGEVAERLGLAEELVFGFGQVVEAAPDQAVHADYYQ
jgi:hypothetical protein